MSVSIEKNLTTKNLVITVQKKTQADIKRKIGKLKTRSFGFQRLWRINLNINILGTEYTVSYKKAEDDKTLLKCNGYTDWTTKSIVVCNTAIDELSLKNMPSFEEKVLRHEIIHAFLYESGLTSESDWAHNEEMVDWFAMQYNKIHKAIEDALDFQGGEINN